MIASGETLRNLRPVMPFLEKSVAFGMSYGVSHAGYDIRLAQSFKMRPGDFHLGSTIERFTMPNRWLGIVHDKSTWARKGLSVFNTVIEPGWEGYLTLELSNRGDDMLTFECGMPIAQVVFHFVDRPVDGYDGKYQGQGPDPQGALFEA